MVVTLSGRFGADAGKHVRAGRGRDQFAYFADFASPGQVDDLCVGQQVCGGGGDGAVQALRSQRSASDQHQRTVRIDAKLRGRFTAYGGTVVTDAFGQGGDGRAQRQTDALDVGSGTRFETGASYTVPMKSAQRAPSLLAMPARAFCSWMAIGMPILCAVA